METKVFKVAKATLRDNPDVTSIGKGYRYKNGKRTKEVVIVVGVAKKLPTAQVRRDRILPRAFLEVPIDVQDQPLEAQTQVQTTPESLVGKMRPCPPGYSIGHYLITAGTLGFWAKRNGSDDWVLFSNNHVLANSNDARPNDEIRQPGKHDGGTSSHRFALLTEFVKINFEGKNGKKKAAKFLWKMWKAPANALARVAGCPYRLEVTRPGAVEQPDPNLVDLAWAKPMLPSYVETTFPLGVGDLRGIRDLELGDRVQKVGRTTEHTLGMVVAVESFTRVNYGSAGIAAFDDQLQIRADEGDFSAGGDSGSAILSMDNYLGGLLFAGGGGVTIANPIRHVVALGGVRL